MSSGQPYNNNNYDQRGDRSRDNNRIPTRDGSSSNINYQDRRGGDPQQQQQRQRRQDSASDSRKNSETTLGGTQSPNMNQRQQQQYRPARETPPPPPSNPPAQQGMYDNRFPSNPAMIMPPGPPGGMAPGYGPAQPGFLPMGPGYPMPPPSAIANPYGPAPGFPGAPMPMPGAPMMPGMAPPPPMGPIGQQPMRSPSTPGQQQQQQQRQQPIRQGSAASNKDEGVISRKKTHRVVELTEEGNLVIDIPVPDRVLELGQYKKGDEFTHMRYTAATTDADNFAISGYTLRQQEFNRKTEVFIVVTMYNEDDALFCKTMVALMKNIAYLCNNRRSDSWGQEGWKNAVICIVSDGRTKINRRVLEVLGLMGVYQDGIMKNKVNDKDVTAHIFEYTAQFVVDGEMNLLGPQQGIIPTQILFCLKEKNAKKINSHRWFFNAFGQLIRPNVCVLIDVGTKPTETSVYNLWRAFDRNPQVGGACGEIYAELGSGCVNLFNPLVAAQNFEYKMSNILDKPLESAFGFIAVLPGAFSAYRYQAIQGTPLQQYFQGEVMHDGDNIFAANMYLAEDRILCFELVTKVGGNWILRYVRAAKAETDVPNTVPEFISQRRRWLNGSFFATIHALSHWFYLFRSDHSFVRKLFFCIEFFYNLVSVIFGWFGLANFYLTFLFLVRDPIVIINSQTIRPLPEGPILLTVLQNVYIMCIVLVFVCSLGNRPQGSKITYTLCMILFAMIMALILYLSFFDVYGIVKDANLQTNSFTDIFMHFPAFRDMLLSVGATYGIYFLSSILYLDPWHMLTSMWQYMMLLPSYVNILNVYAFCNLHDVSWGTKGDNTASGDLGVAKSTKGKDGKDTVDIDVPTDKDDINRNYARHLQALRQARPDEKKSRDAKTKQQDYFKNFRTRIILWWMFTNGILIVVLSNQSILSALYSSINFTPTGDINPYLKFIFYSNLGLATFRFIGSMVYLINSIFY